MAKPTPLTESSYTALNPLRDGGWAFRVQRRALKCKDPVSKRWYDWNKALTIELRRRGLCLNQGAGKVSQ